MAPPARTRPPTGETEPGLTTRDIRRRAASGAALLTAKGALTQALGLLSTIVVTRFLAPHDIGLFAISVTISTFLFTLGGGVGLAGALIRHPVAPERADLRAFVALQLGITSVLAIVVALATLPLGAIGELTALMVASLPITAFRGASLITLERRLLYKRLATAETAEMIAYYGWTIVTLIIGWGVWGLATAVIVRSVVGTAFIVALSPTGVIWPRFDRRRIRAICGIGVRVQAVEFIAATRDQLLVAGTAIVGSVTVVAYWSLVLRLLQAPGMLLSSLLRVTFPAMTRSRAAGRDPSTMLPRLLAAATVLAGTLLVPLAGAAPAFVPLLFGHRWSPAAGGLAIACLAVVIHMPVVIAGQSYLWVAGDGKAPLRAMAADAVIVVVGGVALVPRFGVVGIGIAGVAAAIVHTAILVRAVDNHTGLGVFRHIRVPVLAWVVAAAVAWVCAELAGPLLVRTIISSLVAVSVYLGLLFLTRRELMVSIAGYARPWIERHLLRRKRVPVPVT